MPEFNINLPQFGPEDLDDATQRRRILGYLYSLHEQLRYLLMNLDEDNLGEGLKETLTSSGRIVQAVQDTVQSLNGTVRRQGTAIEQTAEAIALKADQEDLDAMGQRVSSAEAALSVMPDEISAAVSAVQVGGGNLFTGTRGFTGNDWLNLVNYGWYTDGSYNGCVVKSRSAPWNYPIQEVSVEAGEYYTYSCWIKASQNDVNIRSYFTDATGTWCVTDPNYYAGNTNADASMGVIGTAWARKSFTVKVTQSGLAKPGIQVSVTGVTWSVCGIKFERGSRATDWSESMADMQSLEASVSVLQGEVALKASQSSLDALGNTVSGHTAELSLVPGQITAAVGAVQIGGRNLFVGTQRFDSFDANGPWTRYANWLRSNDTYNGCSIMAKSVAWNCMSQKVNVESGKTYTYSAWVKAASSQQVQFIFYRGETTGHCTVVGSTVQYASVGTAWTRVSFTVTVDQGGIAEPGVDVQNNGVAWYICGIKLELGNKATDWSDATDELYAGTTVKITKDEFNVSTPRFNVDINSSTEHFTLDANGGTMDNLTVNRALRAPNIAEVWTGGTYVTVGTNGTYRSLTEFANAINNKILKGTTAIGVGIQNDLSENVVLGGWSGTASVVIYGSGHTLNGSLTIRNSGLYTWVDSLTVNGETSIVTSMVRMDGMTFNGGGISISSQALVWLRKCQLANTTAGISVTNSTLVAWKCRGGSSSGSSVWGYGSIIQWDTSTSDSNPWQSGESSNMRPLGNVILTACITTPSSILNNVTPTALNGTTPAPAATTTATFNCTASRTNYDSTHWVASPDNGIRQGYAGIGDGTYEISGCMWFDLSSLSGKTIKSATLTLTRISGYGRSSEVDVHLYATPLTSASGNPNTNATDLGVLGTIANGETKTFTVPVSAISASSTRGLMLRANDGAVISGRSYSDNYARFYGYGESNAPALTVTYQ